MTAMTTATEQVVEGLGRQLRRMSDVLLGAALLDQPSIFCAYVAARSFDECGECPPVEVSSATLDGVHGTDTRR
jgi:hypothetical protein